MLKRRKSANTKALHNKYGPKFAIKNRKLKENRGNAKGADKLSLIHISEPTRPY